VLLAAPSAEAAPAVPLAVAAAAVPPLAPPVFLQRLCRNALIAVIMVAVLGCLGSLKRPAELDLRETLGEVVGDTGLAQGLRRMCAVTEPKMSRYFRDYQRASDQFRFQAGGGKQFISPAWQTLRNLAAILRLLQGSLCS